MHKSLIYLTVQLRNQFVKATGKMNWRLVGLVVMRRCTEYTVYNQRKILSLGFEIHHNLKWMTLAHLRIFEPTIILNRFIIDHEKFQTHVLLQDISIILVQVFCKKHF